jgi:hypothetical protein
MAAMFIGNAAGCTAILLIARDKEAQSTTAQPTATPQRATIRLPSRCGQRLAKPLPKKNAV